MGVPDSARSALAPVARFLRLVRPAVRRRPSVRIWDRIEAVLILVLSAALFGSVPICFGLASSVFAADQAADARAGVRYQVTARVFPGPPVLQTAGSEASPGTRRVRGMWTAPDGAARSGDLTVELGPTGPQTVKIWVDRQGLLRAAPRTTADLLFVALMYGVAVEFCAVVAVALVYVTTRWWLDRLRARGWDREWRRLTGVGTDA
ncbi:Rv1733c family protein [Amycolatopsis sp. CA-161197]|uniref:Rv1733c family protein n=1 Tax=Amycolatopsis sp. CA-161197 TaxID=3239922 RepID=UPI003D912768